MPPWTRDTRFPIGRIKKIMQQDEEVAFELYIHKFDLLHDG